MFKGPTARLVPLPSRAALRSAETTRLAWVAAKSGAAMMVATLTAQAQSTATTQLLARMGTGLQYRATIVGRIEGNFWLAGILGGLFRLVGSKYFGADLRGLFWWVAGLCVKGSVVLASVGTITMAVFYDSAPWTFASSKICSLLEHRCSVPEYEELYGNDFRLTYWIEAILQPIGGLAGILPACLYAAQDFDFVRNISAAGLVLLFAPLAALGYHLDSFLLLQLAGWAPALLTAVGCAWRLRRLWQQGDAEASGQRDYGREPGSVNEGLADYRRSRGGRGPEGTPTAERGNRSRTQELARGRYSDHRRAAELSDPLGERLV